MVTLSYTASILLVFCLVVVILFYVFTKKDPVPQSHIADSDVCEIIPRLFLSSHVPAQDFAALAQRSICYVLSITGDSFVPPAYPPEIIHKSLKLIDYHTADISSLFGEAIDFIDAGRNSGNGVLVHCMAGVSRSPTLVLAYLIAKENYNLANAYELVQKRRPIIHPNHGFVKQLMNFEFTRIGQKSELFYAQYIIKQTFISKIGVKPEQFVAVLRRHNYDVNLALEDVLALHRLHIKESSQLL